MTEEKHCRAGGPAVVFYKKGRKMAYELRGIEDFDEKLQGVPG